LIFFWEFMLNSPIQDWCASCKDHNYSQNWNKLGMTFVGLVLHLLGYMNSKIMPTYAYILYRGRG
jgi:hypothetical protein